MNREKRKQFVAEIENSFGKEFEKICHYIFEHAELGLEEFKSSKYLIDYMADKGFEIKAPCCGLETAFTATKGRKGLKIAFLAEYDALPGYGPDKVNGHACGHNWIAATTAGAAVTLAEFCEKNGIEAQVVLVGTPAEETYGAKVKMAKEHLFDDVDLCLQPHLEAHNSITSYGLAMTSMHFIFSGKAAHSSMLPWNGINALDAVQLMFAGINAMRQHIKPDARIHGIVVDGGEAPNTVPDKASALFYVRALKRSYADELVKKMLNIAKGAELMTGATLSVEYPEMPYDDVVRIPVLQGLMDTNLREEGIIPNISDEESAANAGSTDLGNVSYACPTMYVEVALDSPEPFLCHEESALCLADSHWAYEKMHQMVRVLVNVAMDALDNPKYITQAKEELRERL